MRFFKSQTRCPGFPGRRTTRPRLERLEERQLLTGFGPGDGASIVETWVGGYASVQIQPADQKIVAAGTAVARYDWAGNPDVSYGSGGLAQGVGNAAGGLALQSDGKAVVAASLSSNGYYYIGAGRLNSNGTLDKTFGSGGWNGVSVASNYFPTTSAIGLTSTGKIVVGGFQSPITSGFTRTAVLAGFKASGALDSGTGGFGDLDRRGRATGSTFATFSGQLADFNSLVVQPDNKVVAVVGPITSLAPKTITKSVPLRRFARASPIEAHTFIDLGARSVRRSK